MSPRRQEQGNQGGLRPAQRDLDRRLTPIAEIRKAIDAAGHPALFMVDTISSLASADYRHDEWGVDVSIGGAQKGLMLPPGMSFNAISDKAIKANEKSRCRSRSSPGTTCWR